MDKTINFSRFVGISVVVICVIVVILALMSAILKNENNDNIVYVDDGAVTGLTMPKSNIITEYLNIEKEIEIENTVVSVDVRLPKINIQTEATNNINTKIYETYQNIYSDISSDETVQEINIDYTYDYLNNGTILEITVTKEIIKSSDIEEICIKYVYDLQNDMEKQ